MHVEQGNPGEIQAVELRLDALGGGDRLSWGKEKISAQTGTENRPEGLRDRVQASREEDMSKSRQESGGPGLSNYDGEGENYLEKKNTLPLATDWKVKTIDKVF